MQIDCHVTAKFATRKHRDHNERDDKKSSDVCYGDGFSNPRLYLLPNATDPDDKAVFSACEVAYKAVVSSLQSAYTSMNKRDYVAMKAQQNQALRSIDVCEKRTNFFRRTPIVADNYYVRLMVKIASIAGQIRAPCTTLSTSREQNNIL
ncbi:Invertase/pectin methylesterase inhibitor domain superfamily [Arabidopsis thaliana x Arabidopsis arenosa]|uniref:Invertase/pectin methylesterase inhibitor domain superfamily n=1 Tax=Arabidopsis thaliana x Arabidopsis arenosa TaxID=1240361 RepID=A0A8T1YYY0_9BRAS|nr:Invertase/pectin methylesterase inhibitor domain superfamily [Arabidopsis thaliana x Arabidopsis arenosa]